MANRQLCVFALLASVGTLACQATARPPRDVLVPVQGCDTVSTVRVGNRPALPPAPPLSADAAALVGTVADRQTGVALIGAVVRLRGPASREAVSDSLGSFAVSPLPSGRFSVQVVRIGYDPFTGSVDLEPGRADTLRIGLQYRACP